MKKTIFFLPFIFTLNFHTILSFPTFIIFLEHNETGTLVAGLQHCTTMLRLCIEQIITPSNDIKTVTTFIYSFFHKQIFYTNIKHSFLLKNNHHVAKLHKKKPSISNRNMDAKVYKFQDTQQVISKFQKNELTALIAFTADLL